jgi:hypothetical protein
MQVNGNYCLMVIYIHDKSSGALLRNLNNSFWWPKFI